MPYFQPQSTSRSIRVVTLPAATPTRLCAVNANRNILELMNIGTGLCTLGKSDVTAGNGWALNAAAGVGQAGGSWSSQWVPETGEIWGVSTAGTTIVVMEG